MTPRDERPTPAIRLWHGDRQRFGIGGRPAHACNVLGRVRPLPEAREGGRPCALFWRWEGGQLQPLSLGPDQRRLAAPGDFNLELDWDAFPEGLDRTLEFVLQRPGAPDVVRAVRLILEPPAAVPPAAAGVWNWGDGVAAALAQPAFGIADGRWHFEPGAARPIEFGYDRLLLIGDRSWRDYEVRTTLRLHGYNAGAFEWPSVHPAAGLVLHWPGHTHHPFRHDTVPLPRQPRSGVLPVGALAWYAWRPEHGFAPELWPNLRTLHADTSFPAWRWGRAMHLRAQAIGSTEPARYRLKIWPRGTAEPDGWNLSAPGAPDGPRTGCLGLVAHHLAAEFGPVTVCPLSSC